jgi:hypothetical protein
MAWSYRWFDDDQTILVCDVRDSWTWEEAFAIVEEQVAHMHSVSHGVHTIYWLHGIPILPQDGMGLPNLQKLMSQRQPNSQLVIFIGINRFGEKLAGLMKKVYGMRDQLAHYRFVSSIEQALDEIALYQRESA